MKSPISDKMLAELEAEFHLQLAAELKTGMWQYLQLLEKWNQRLSLTALVEEEQILRYHFFESFWAAEQFLSKEDTHLVDIGSGAGFPGLAIALYRPTMKIALIESNRKKVVFLEETVRRLGQPVHVSRCRAEDFGRWPDFKVATVRAVRLTPRLLQILSGTGIELLWFHGGDDPSPDKWKVTASKKVPGSQSRTVSRLVLAG